MPYQLTGILKLPDGTPASNVDIEFISQANYSPLVRDLSNTIRTSEAGSYSVELEYGEYAIRLLYASAYPLHPGKIYVYADTPAGQDLPTLMQAANWTPATPDYIVQIQNWLVEAKVAHDGAMESAAEAKASELAAKASEIAVEADRAEVATNKAAVSASQADVTTKQADVAAKAAQVASDKAATEAAKTAAVGASNSASASASSASGSESAAAASAANSELSALRAEAAAGSLVVEEIPFPDVWIPFSDSLVMLAGYGDEIKVGSYVVARMASFSRASGATYIDKSGTLRTAAANEPRFEKEGLLIESQSTNLIETSEAVNFAVYGGVTSVSTDTTTIPGFRLVKLVNDGAGPGNSPSAFGAQSFAVGDVLTFSAVFKMEEGVTGGRFRLRLAEGSTFWRDFSFYCDMRDESISGVTYTKTTPFADKSLVKVTATWTCDTAKTAAFGQLQSLQVAGTCYVGCFQFEKLPLASSYIPTNGATAARAADFVSIPEAGNNCVEWYSGGTPITPTKEGGRIKFSGQAHHRNIRGFMTALTAAQKASIR